jgi:hypothetical protein
VEINAQSRNHERNLKGPQKVKVDTSKTVIPVDTVLADRDVTFNLKKLSMLASLSVYGKAKYKGDGVVVVEVKVTETGFIQYVIIRESDNPKLNKPASDAVENYAKKYKLQPAIKDGKPVEQDGILLPVVFDMSIFEQGSR